MATPEEPLKFITLEEVLKQHEILSSIHNGAMAERMHKIMGEKIRKETENIFNVPLGLLSPMRDVSCVPDSLLRDPVFKVKYDLGVRVADPIRGLISVWDVADRRSGSCTCHTGNPPCSYCTDGGECDACCERVSNAEDELTECKWCERLLCEDCIDSDHRCNEPT